jgi:hypothetical protein
MTDSVTKTPETTEIRPAKDASDDTRLQRDPSHEDAKLDVALDESFPTSDAPSNTQPGKGKDPAPSSGFDEKEEERIAALRP